MSMLEQGAAYEVTNDLGYITSSPTNLGTGLEATYRV
jgi:protein-arginine kinase